MRLEKIKLAGFKSFVDSTTIPFAHDLTGIVGPNGCGKSNVIDAVRWVLGESSAKHLRGGQMADVIFNGSSSRQPIGQAFVELLFDNSKGTITGEYASYAEIALKRLVNREGQSSYFLNGVRCRRKDITALFMGTGLGPRSYSIIEQGTISRLIEAKPDELRSFIEEAAGISIYKERRRDTENRMRHARENLERVADLCEEIEKQCQHLKRQASTAEKYKSLKLKERQIRSQLLALKWQMLDQLDLTQTATLQKLQVDEEKMFAGQRKVEKNLENQRSKYQHQRKEWTVAQEIFYTLGADISKLEQSLEHSQLLRNQNKNQIEQYNKQIEWANIEFVKDQQLEKMNDEKLVAINEKMLEKKSKQISAQEKLLETEQLMMKLQQKWEDFSQHASEAKYQIEHEKNNAKQYEKHLTSLSRRVSLVSKEKAKWQQALSKDDVERLESELNQHRTTYQLDQLEVNKIKKNMMELRQKVHDDSEKLAKLRDEHARLTGRLASINTLQQSGTDSSHSEIKQWLEKSKLDHFPILLEKLDVVEGWEKAVEVVLGNFLKAHCIDNFETTLDHSFTFPEGELALLSAQHVNPEKIAKLPATALARMVNSEMSGLSLLYGVHVAENTEQARLLLTKLNDTESVITKTGVWLRTDMLCIRNIDDKENLLALEKERKHLFSQAEDLSSQITQLRDDLVTCRDQLHITENDYHLKQKRDIKTGSHLSQLERVVAEKRSVKQQASQRLLEIDKEQALVLTEQQQDENALLACQKSLKKLNKQQLIVDKQRQQLLQQRDSQQLLLDTARSNVQHIHDRVHQDMLQLETLRSSQALILQNSKTISQRLEEATYKRNELSKNLQQGQAPFKKQKLELDTLLQKHSGSEDALSSTRHLLDQQEKLIQDSEKERHQSELNVQQARDRLSTAKVEHQHVLTRKETLLEQSEELGIELLEILSDLPKNANEHTWQNKANVLATQIERLGAINLVAIDEYATQMERKQYLDNQMADLNDSLETLILAIDKIDKESRALFKQTFEHVNTGFAKRFPKLFDGGHAYLELLGEDSLSAGVVVMARPPGKKNSSIHLLSGGEKALTAIALVFAIFDLNPSPFCILDEVDAPLDEKNVSRFTEFVKDMSDKVQMVLITHNKVTMQVMHQLTGVTMKEPGVSRIVAVDLQEATKWVAS